MSQQVLAALVIIGDEILSGRTQDSNLAYLAKWLNEIGIQLGEVRVVSDVTADIVAAVNALRARFDYVFTTGGIGPTHDDITAESVAAAFGLPVIKHPEAYARLLAHYGAEKFTEARQRMTRVPEGATLIDNPVSIAPGFQIGNVFVMAGVPLIMQAMLEGIRPRLKGGHKIISRTVTIFTAESALADPLSRIQEAHPAVSIGSYPFFSNTGGGAQIVARGPDAVQIDAVIAALISYCEGQGLRFEEVTA
ncbi:competence/damage-inducible protein A [Pseudokordiimonas caeni]|uniref:competence/damage-inducible protein A n=1 Tax=Pseudokordiimonas caeni TaxID=2997908 RepID=UPI002810D46F|nr:competence/damage-inducible protein A [Pseudokordiimonas caeni]